MHFAHPVFLLAAVILAVALTLLFAHQAAARRRALRHFGSPHLIGALTFSVSVMKRRVKEVLVVLGVALVAIALARPELGFRWEEVHRRGVDILFAVDTSKSMLTPDVKPNRLERAKLAVRDLVAKFPDDRVGLVAFAGSAFLQTPLTLDHAIFEQSLQALDTDVIPLGGTNVASAIKTAGGSFADDGHKKVVVLLTDGEDLEGDAVAAAKAAAQSGLVIYTVGVGSPSGELIPLGDNHGTRTFVKDAQGKFVVSRLDEPRLRQIAAATGGAYRPLGDNGTGLERLYEEDMASLPRSDLAARSRKVPIDRFQWPLGLGALLLALEPLIGERRRARAIPIRDRATGARSWLGRLGSAPAVVAFAMLLVPTVAHASPQSAERAYRGGRFEQAESEYADAAKSKPDDARLAFNLGDSAYRNGNLEAASKAFEQALHTSDLKVQERAYYNLGDATYRAGEATLKAGKTDETIGIWKRAVADYEAALHLESSDGDATFNRDFVKRKLSELEKKQEEQKKQNDQNQSDKKQPSKGGEQKKEPSAQNGKAQGNGSMSDGKSQASGNDKGSESQGGKPPSSGSVGGGEQPKPSAANPSNPKADTGPQPGTAGKDGRPEPATPGGSAPGDDKADDTPSAPGELSKGEARALLDSLRGDLQLRAAPPPNAPKAADAPPQKDW